jgi:hypothetical protein
MYTCASLPLMYLWGVLCVFLKALLLNPPCMKSLLSRLTFEAEVPFPGSNPEERMRFARRWYSTEPRTGLYGGRCCGGVSSRFTHLEDRQLWMEKFAIFRWLVLPVMCASCSFDASSQQWTVHFGRLMPHALVGCVVIGEKPDGTGWMVKGNFECWIWLGWLYKWIVVRILGMYAEQMEAVEEQQARAKTADLEAATPNEAAASASAEAPSLSLPSLLGGTSGPQGRKCPAESHKAAAKAKDRGLPIISQEAVASELRAV